MGKGKRFVSLGAFGMGALGLWFCLDETSPLPDAVVDASPVGAAPVVAHSAAESSVASERAAWVPEAPSPGPGEEQPPSPLVRPPGGVVPDRPVHEDPGHVAGCNRVTGAGHAR